MENPNAVYKNRHVNVSVKVSVSNKKILLKYTYYLFKMTEVISMTEI